MSKALHEEILRIAAEIAPTLDLRALKAQGETQRAIAAHFGVSGPTVCRVVKFKIWGHVK